MEVTFYMPYNGYNDGDFDADNSYYKDNDEYFNAMRDEISKSDGIVSKKMSGYLRGDSLGSYVGQDDKTYSFNTSPKNNEKWESYSSCKGTIIDESGNEKSVDEIVSDIIGGDIVLFTMRLDIDTADEEFESSLYVWVDEHNKISEYGKKLGDDWIFENETKNDIYIKFKNKSNKDKYAVMEGCKMLERTNITDYVILAEKITFVNGFDERLRNG